jgi:hypothetical protein
MHPLDPKINFWGWLRVLNFFVPNVFPWSPNGFPICSSVSQCVPEHVPQNTLLYPIIHMLCPALSAQT